MKGWRGVGCSQGHACMHACRGAWHGSMRGAGGNAHLAPSPGGGPERLVVLMEAEALLNDASAITLFEVFMHIIEQHISPAMPYPSVWSVLPTIITQTLKCAHGACSCGETGQRPFFPPVGRAQGFGGPALPSRAGKHALPIQPPPPTHDERRRLAGIGFGIGLAMSWCTFHFLHWLRWRGAKPYVENSVIIAVAYLSFYVANDPAKATAACWWF